MPVTQSPRSVWGASLHPPEVFTAIHVPGGCPGPRSMAGFQARTARPSRAGGLPAGWTWLGPPGILFWPRLPRGRLFPPVVTAGAPSAELVSVAQVAFPLTPSVAPDLYWLGAGGTLPYGLSLHSPQ